MIPLLHEDGASQVPALQLLQNLGWQYLSPEEATALRGGRAGGVLLDGILEQQLRALNRIEVRGRVYPFSESNIAEGIRALKEFRFDGLVRTNEAIYDLLCLGKSLPQTILGDTKSHTLRYIDWRDLRNNVFHVTEEFVVERTGSREVYRPDLVLFVNGIPLAVIECKRPVPGPGVDPLDAAIAQHLRNQRDDGIPRLFAYSQVLLAVAVNQAKYATTGTAAKFWACWKEPGSDAAVREAINRPLTGVQKDRLYVRETRAVYGRPHFEALEKAGPREPTEQDRLIFALCQPARLLDLAYRFVLYDAGEKKIARYQQFFCVKNILERVQQRLPGGARKGGVVWHTQGSGKSLTMVMLAKALALDEDIPNPKIVLVTDRVDLDDQIYGTFRHCGEEIVQARTGRHLVDLLQDRRKRIVATVIDKFEAAAGQPIDRIDDNTFVLVDEGHRGQYRTRHARMRRSMKAACFIAFTGTPIMKEDRDTFRQFGGPIEPSYTLADAVADRAVVPLLYEGRHVPQTVHQQELDGWFDKLTRALTPEQAADLKRKFATADQLNKAEQKVRMIAWDISAHYRTHWKNTGFKGQLVAPDKATALLYKRFLDEFGLVEAAVLISGPDEREGEDEADEQSAAVLKFWKETMAKYGTEKQYNKLLINAFKSADAPEIVIVVDKLLTGFDAPRNAILYLTRKLTGHTLLQAIARVNRLHDGKEFGYILDYRGVLEELDRALDFYADLREFDSADVDRSVIRIDEEIARLPHRHSALRVIFRGVKNTRDREQYERLLAPPELRLRFYERFAAFARTLGIALSSTSFLDEVPEEKLTVYRDDLAFFRDLRASVRRRYAEVIDYSEYEPRIRKLIDTHVGTGEVETVVSAVDLFDKGRRAEILGRREGKAAMADTIAYNTKRVIEVHLQEDPAFYKRFSEMIEEAIAAFRAQRLKEADYLKQVMSIRESVLSRSTDALPPALRNEDMARRYFGILNEVIPAAAAEAREHAGRLAEAALGLDRIIEGLRIRDWATNQDRQNQMRTAMEDFLIEWCERTGQRPEFERIDRILERSLDIARRVRP